MGHKTSSREVRMIVAPSCLVVLVHGMRMLAEVDPLGSWRKETMAVRVTWKRGLKLPRDFTVVSPRRRQPKNVVKAVAQTAAWKGVEMSRLARRFRRCSRETGERRGRLNDVPCLLPVMRARLTHSSSPYHGARFAMCQERIPESQDLIVFPEYAPAHWDMKAVRSAAEAGMRSRSSILQESQN